MPTKTTWRESERVASKTYACMVVEVKEKKWKSSMTSLAKFSLTLTLILKFQKFYSFNLHEICFHTVVQVQVLVLGGIGALPSESVASEVLSLWENNWSK